MAKFQVKLTIEAYVWLEAESAREAKHKAEASMALGQIVSSEAQVFHGIEVCGSEASDVFELAEGVSGVLTSNRTGKC